MVVGYIPYLLVNTDIISFHLTYLYFFIGVRYQATFSYGRISKIWIRYITTGDCTVEKSKVEQRLYS